MTFPDSSKKAPNVFFETFDGTGSPTTSSPTPTSNVRVSAPPPSPPPTVNIRWYAPPTVNNGNVTISNPTDVIVEFAPPAPPVADFSGTPISGNAPLQVQFTDLSTNAPTAWAWDFENNGIIDSTAQNPIHIYSTPGTYNVKLTASNTGGSSSITKNAYITVNVAPVIPTVDFSGTPLTGIVPLSVQFTDLSTDAPNAWQWDFENDGIIDSSLQNPQHTYSTVGTYSVKLTASNNAGANSLTKTAYITVSPVPPQASYLTTEIYPVDALESAQGAPVVVLAGNTVESPNAYAQAASVNVVSGTLTQTFFPAFYAADIQEAQSSAVSVLSGTLTATFFPAFYTADAQEAQAAPVDILSGTLVQTFFPLAITQPPEEAQAASITILSGTLI